MLKLYIIFNKTKKMWIYIIIFIITIISIFNLLIYFLSLKINELERSIILLFKKRNNQVVSVYQVTKTELNRANEVYKEFFELKRKDFLDNNLKIGLKEKLITYKKIHSEIDFIFKTCEKNKKLIINPKYLYLKDSILDKSNEIWIKFELYNKIKIKYSLYKKISNLTLIWILIK